MNNRPLPNKILANKRYFTIALEGVPVRHDSTKSLFLYDDEREAYSAAKRQEHRIEKEMGHPLRVKVLPLMVIGIPE